MRSLILLFFTSHFALAQSQDFNLKIYVQENDSSLLILGDNNEAFPISLNLDVDLKGTVLKSRLEDYYVLAPKTEQTLLATIIKPVNKSWSYKFGYNYSLGNALAKHNDSYAYRLPFSEGKSFRLTQGYNGGTTHRGLNALDFTMPEGEPVHAAREGLVVRIKEDSDRGCPSPSCANDANYITILHDDGTLADYVHLQRNGALVEVGDSVERGQKIGLNGDTGWASGAHLHFIVYTTGEHAQESIQVKFETQPGKIESLKENAEYTSFK